MNSNLFKDMVLTYENIIVYGRSKTGKRYLGKGQMKDFPQLFNARVLATIVNFNDYTTEVIIVDDPKCKGK